MAEDNVQDPAPEPQPNEQPAEVKPDPRLVEILQRDRKPGDSEER